MKFKGIKILVVGGAGFIGSATVETLTQEGADVLVLDNFSGGRKENVNPKAKIYEGDITNFDFKKLFNEEGPEAVFHFASNVEVPKSNQNPMLDMDSIVGSVNLLSGAINSQVKKIIFSSSGFIYGNCSCLPIKEETEPKLVSSYAIAKYSIEKYLEFFHRVHGLEYIVLRYATAYGPGQKKGAMSDYIRKLADGKQSEIWGDGSKTRDYVYISDVVKANLLALEADIMGENPVFNIGTGIETSLKDVYSKIAALLGKKAEPVYCHERAGELEKYCLDYTKASKILGWKPDYSLEEGLSLRLKKENLI